MSRSLTMLTDHPSELGGPPVGFWVRMSHRPWFMINCRNLSVPGSLIRRFFVARPSLGRIHPKS